VFLASLILAGGGGRVLAQDVVADGRTGTAIATTGSVTDITTGTVAGGFGVNSFARFGVAAGAAVNVHAPAGTAGTVNIVNGPRSVIHGTVTAMQGGAAGGAFYLANPDGVTVGPGGRIIAGGIGLSTPTRGYADGVFGSDGMVDAARVGAIAEGSAPQSAAGIEVAGAVAGDAFVRLTTGGDITVSGHVTAGARAAQMAGAVNLGDISMRAGGAVRIASGARVEAAGTTAGGGIDIRSGAAIRVDTGALVAAEGRDSGDGGRIILFADTDAFLETGALVSASAQGSGDGGFVEFSAAEMVVLRGELRTWSASGDNGQILIDPVDLVRETDWFTNGDDVHMIASRSITIAEGVVISTRRIAGSDHVQDASNGRSGDLTLEAPEIIVSRDAMLLAHGTDTIAGGDIYLYAHEIDSVDLSEGPTFEGTARIAVDQALIWGETVRLLSEVRKDNIIATPGAVSDYAADALSTGFAPIDNMVGTQAARLDTAVNDILAQVDALNLPSRLTAEAVTRVNESYILADGLIDIGSVAETVVRIAPDNASLAVAFASTRTVAETIVERSQIVTDGRLDLNSRTNEVVELVAGGNDAATQDNVALAVSFRRSRAETILTSGTFGLREIEGIERLDYPSVQTGGRIDITARADKDIALTAASGGNADGTGQAVIVSLEDTVTRAALHVPVGTDGANANVLADTVYARNTLLAVTGDDDSAPPPAADPDDADALGGTLDGLRGTLATGLSLGGVIDGASFILDRSTSVTEAQLGSEYPYTSINGGQRFTGLASYLPVAHNSGDLAPAGVGLTLAAVTDLGEATLRAVVANDADDDRSRGGTAIIADHQRETLADSDSAIVEGAPAVTVTADLKGSLSLEHEAGSGQTLSLSYGWLRTDWATRARLVGMFQALGDISVLATEDVAIANVQEAVNETEGGSGNYGLALTSYGSDVTATVENLFMYEDSRADLVQVRAQSLSEIDTFAVRNGEITDGDASSSAAATAMVVSTGTVRALVQGASLYTEDLSVLAEDRTARQTVANAASESDATKVVGAFAHDDYARSTRADMVGVFVVAKQDAAVAAVSATSATSIALGRATGEEGFGFTSLAAWTTDRRDVAAMLEGGVDVGGDLTVSATRDDRFILLQATDATSERGVGLAAGILQMSGETRADAQFNGFASVGEGGDDGGDADDGGDDEEGEEGGGGTNAVAGDLRVTAINATQAISLTLGFGSSGKFQGVGSAALLSMGQLADDTPVDDITDALLDDGAQRGEDGRAAALDVRNSLAADLIAAGAAGGLDIDPDAGNAAAIVARLGIESTTMTVGGETEVTATDDRRGTAVTGQLQAGLVSQAIGIFDSWFSIDDIARNGITFSLRPATVGEAVDTTVDVVTTGINAAFAIDEFAGVIKDGGTIKTEATTAGLSLSDVRIGGTVAALVEMTRFDNDPVYMAGALVSEGALRVAATNDARANAVALGLQVGNSSIGASFAMSRLNQATLALISGGSVDAGSVTVAGDMTGRANSISGTLLASYGGGFLRAAGGSVSLTDMDAATVSGIAGASVTARGALDVTAVDESQAVAAGVSVGGSTGGNALTGAVSILSQRSLLRAEVVDTVARANGGSLRIDAYSAAVTDTITLQGGGSGGTLAVGAAVADTGLFGVTEALVTGSDLRANGVNTDVQVEAETRRRLAALAATVNAGGTVGGSGSVTLITREDVTRARVTDSNLRAADSVLVEALSDVDFGSIAGGDEGLFAGLDTATINLAFGSTAGIGVSVAIIASGGVTEALVTGDTSLIANAREASDGVSSRLRDADDGPGDADRHDYRGIAVVADSDVEARVLALSASAAGTVAVSAQVPVVVLRDAVTAATYSTGGAGPMLTAAEGVDIRAGNASDLHILSFVGQGSGVVSGGADIESITLDKTTLAYATDTAITTNGDATVQAVAPDRMESWSASLSVSGQVAVSGVIQSALSRSLTHAWLEGATVTAGGALTVAALAPREVVQNAANLALGIGIAGVGGTVLVLTAEDEVEAEVADGVAGLGTVIDVDGAVTIAAEAALAIDTVAVGGGGGLVGVSGAFVYLRADQVVSARFGDHATMTEGRAQSLTVAATQDLGVDATVGNLSGGLVAVGGAVLSVRSGSQVTAEIGDGAVVRATGHVDVAATGLRYIDAVSAAIGGGGLALQGSLTRVVFGIDAEDVDSAETTSLIADDLGRADAFSVDGRSMDAGEARVFGVLSDAAEGRQASGAAMRSSSPEDVMARVGAGADVQAGAVVSIRAQESGAMDLLSGGAGVGGVAFSAAMTRMRAGSELGVEVESGARIVSDGEVRLSATSDLDSGNPTALAGALGGIVAGAAIAEAHAARVISVTLGDGVFLGDADGRGTDVSITAQETGAVAAVATGVSAGATAVGGVFATARTTSLVEIDMAPLGASPLFHVRDLTIAATRNGDVGATGFGVAGGVFGGVGVDTAAYDSSTVRIVLGAVRIDAGRNVDITASSRAAMDVAGTGAAVGGTAIGATLSRAERLATVTVTGAGANVTADTLEVTAQDALGPSSTEGIVSTVAISSISATGAIKAAGLSGSTLINETEVEIDLRFAVLNTSDLARIEAYTNTLSTVTTKGFSLAGVSIGANFVDVLQDTTARADVGFALPSYVGGDLVILADGRDQVSADARSGTGAFYAVEAAKSDIEIDTQTEVALDGGAGLTVGGALRVTTDRQITFANTGDSLRATFAGGGATVLDSVVFTGSEIEVSGTITADTVAVAALTDVEKDDPGFSGQIGSAGVVDGTALRSETDVFNDARILFAPGAVLTQTAAPDPFATVAGMTVTVTSTYDLIDSVKIDTGGGLALPVARSLIDIGATGTATSTMGNTGTAIVVDDATLRAAGDISLSVTADATASTEAFVNVYGVAGVPFAQTVTEYDADQVIVLTGDAVVRSDQGKVMLDAGGVAGGAHSLDLSSELRVWNATAVPITLPPVARTEAEQDNRIEIGANAAVLAATDVVLTTGEGNLSLYSYGLASDLYREVAEDVVNLFGSLVGSDQVSLDTEVGSVSRQSRNGVLVDGTVESGTNHFQELVAGVGGITRITDGIDAEILTDVDVRGALEDQLARLQDDLAQAEDDNNTLLQERLSEEITRVTQILAGIGTGSIDMLLVHSAFAAAGDVEVTGDYLAGRGTILSNGDATITIVNDGARLVEVRDLTIPFRRGGLITLNDIPLTDAAGLGDLVTAALAAKSSSYLGVTVDPSRLDLRETASGAGAAETLIAVENRYAGTAGGVQGDLYVTGDVTNLAGRVSLFTASGDIMILGGSVEAGEIDISSGGDFLLSAAYDDELTNLGSSPLAVWAPVLATAAASGFPFGGCIDDTCDGFPATIPLGQGTLLAQGNVYVYANRFVNIGGLVQSGITDYVIGIDERLPDLIATLPASDGVSLLYSPAGNVTSPAEAINPATLRPYASGNVTLRYDHVAGAVLVDPVIARGGTIEIVGQIVSTGGGTLSAASGYAHITAENDSDLPLVFGVLSTGYGEGATGRIRIVDLAKPGLSGGFVETLFTQAPNGTVTRTVINPGALTLTRLDTPTYEIDRDWRVMYFTGDLTDRPDGEFEASDVPGNIAEVVLFNFEYGTLFPTGIIQTGASAQTRAVLSQRDVSADYVIDAANPAYLDALDEVIGAGTAALILSDVEDYLFLSGELFDALDPDVVTVSDWELNSTGQYVRERRIDRTEHNYDAHIITANRPVDIAFHGHAAGALTVTSVGDVILDGSVYNRSGTTTITSTGGSVIQNDASLLFEVNRLFLDAADDVGQRLAYDADAEPRPARPFGGASGAFVNLTLGGGLRPFMLDLADGFGLSVVAGGDAIVREINGDIALLAAQAGGTLDLSAPGSILVHPNAAAGMQVAGDVLRLSAAAGGIGTLADPISIATQSVTAAAALDINLLYLGDTPLRVNTIASAAGNVSIVAPLASIADDNATTAVDLRLAEGTLDDLWDDLGLRAIDSDGVAETTRGPALIAAYEAAETAAYLEYWTARRGRDANGYPAGPALPYDPAARVTYGAVERAALAAGGLTEAQITAAEDVATQRFHELHGRFGSGSYDAGFVYVASAAERAALTQGLHRSTAQLSRGLRRTLVDGVTDTEAVIEVANISGVNVNLAAGGSIGRRRADLVINRATGLTEAALAELWLAERADITQQATTIRVARQDDLDIAASGHVVALAGADVFLGSEAAMNLLRVEGAGEVRLASAEGLAMAEVAGVSPLIAGADIVLEGGAGGIGAAGAPLLVSGGSLVARAAGQVRVTAPVGDLEIAEVFSDTGVVIAALTGSLLDGNVGAAAGILAPDVALFAGQAIGAAGQALTLRAADGALNLSAIAVAGDARLTVNGGNVTAGVIGSVTGDTVLRVQEGSLILAGLSDAALADLLLPDAVTAQAADTAPLLPGIQNAGGRLQDGSTAGSILGARPGEPEILDFMGALAARAGSGAFLRPDFRPGAAQADALGLTLAGSGLTGESGGLATLDTTNDFRAVPALNAAGRLTLAVSGDVTGRDGAALDMAAQAADIAVGGSFGSVGNYIVTAFDDPVMPNDGAILRLTDFAPGGDIDPSIYLANIGDLDIRSVELARGSSTVRVIAQGDITLGADAQIRGGRITFGALARDGMARDVIFDTGVTVRADRLNLLATDGVRLDGDGALTIEANLTILGNSLTTGLFCTTDCGVINLEGAHDLRVVTAGLMDLSAVSAPEGRVFLTTTGAGAIRLDDLEAISATLTTNLGDVRLADTALRDLTIRANGSVGDSRFDVTGRLDVQALAVGDGLDSRAVVVGHASQTDVRLTGTLGVLAAFEGAPAYRADLLSTGDSGLGLDVIATSTGLGALTLAEVSSGGTPIGIVADTLSATGNITSGGGTITLRTTEGAFRQTAGTVIDAGTGKIAVTSAGDAQIAQLVSFGGDPVAPMITLSVVEAITGVGTVQNIVAASFGESAVRIGAGAIANGGPAGFWVDARRIDVAVGAGDLHLITGLPDVTITNLRHVGGGLVDMVAVGSVTLDAAIVESADIFGTARGDVILTATGGITGSIGRLTGEHVRLHAFGGALSAEVATAEVGLMSVGASGPVTLTAGTGALMADYVVSETGAVLLAASGGVTVAGLGAGGDVTVGSLPNDVALLAAGTVQTTLPDLPGLLVPTLYRTLVAGTPGTVTLATDAGDGDGGDGDGGGEGDGGEGEGGTGFLDAGDVAGTSPVPSAGPRLPGGFSLVGLPRTPLFGGLTGTGLPGDEDDEDPAP
jgi:filamentous hemagglutinin family protein